MQEAGKNKRKFTLVLHIGRKLDVTKAVNNLGSTNGEITTKKVGGHWVAICGREMPLTCISPDIHEC